MGAEGRPERGRIQLVAAVVGAASLGAEIAAARLLAPYFGASTIVWANTIATVLVALSAGYWVGGGLPAPRPQPRGGGRAPPRSRPDAARAVPARPRRRGPARRRPVRRGAVPAHRRARARCDRR